MPVSPAQASGPTYVAAAELQLKDWGEELALAYDSRKARTHLISAIAASVLKLTTATALDRPALTAALLASLGSEDPLAASPEGDADELDQVIDGLLSAGLLRRLECLPS